MKPAFANSHLFIYRLQIKGQLDDDFLPSYCPPGTRLQRQGELTILANLHTDQSGILGLVRRLHNLGCTLLEMTAQPAE